MNVERRLIAGLGGIVALSVQLIAHDPVATKVSWDREIFPIIQARCVSCHSPGGRGPMSLATYEEARPWARAIREEVLTRRMPLWRGVRGYGDFANDPSLSPFEVALITAWVDGGAPKTLPSSPPAGRTATRLQGWSPPQADVRRISIPCTSRSLPPGRIVAFEPSLDKDAALRVDVAHPDGSSEPLLWIRNYDPAHPDIYWLRTPLLASPRTRVAMEGPETCILTVLLEGGGPR